MDEDSSVLGPLPKLKDEFDWLVFVEPCKLNELPLLGGSNENIELPVLLLDGGAKSKAILFGTVDGVSNEKAEFCEFRVMSLAAGEAKENAEVCCFAWFIVGESNEKAEAI